MLDLRVHRLAMSNPADVSELERLIERQAIDPASIVASIGKTEGNGGANDFTRALATLSACRLIGRYLGESAEEVSERIAFVWSGGCEGVISPHMTVFTQIESAGGSEVGGGLALAVQKTRKFLPEEVGRLAEVEEVAAAVRRAVDGLGITPSEVHYVQVKGPLLTPAGIADALSRGESVVSTDPNRSKVYARGATALGVGSALGEIPPGVITEEAIGSDMNLFSTVASTSAGGELTECEILLFANSPYARSGLRIGHSELSDAADLQGVRASLRNAGLEFDCDPSDEQRRQIRGVFAKAEAPVGGSLRGHRTTMLSDADINYERHARAAVGAVITAVTGDPRVFVSGGTEHQCSPGAAPIAAIIES